MNIRMEREDVATPPILPLTALVEVGGTIYISGQLSMREGKIEGVDVAAQTHLVIDQIGELLASANMDLSNIVKTTVWLTRKEDFAAFNAVYGARFGPKFPARSTVIAALAIDGALVEIEAIAVRGEQ